MDRRDPDASLNRDDDESSSISPERIRRLEEFDRQLRQRREASDITESQTSHQAIDPTGFDQASRTDDDLEDEDFSDKDFSDEGLCEIIGLLDELRPRDGDASTSRVTKSFDEGNASQSFDSDAIFEAHPIGDEIGRFQIRRIIGQGGFGRVFLSHDTVLQRDVAIKAIPTPGHLVDREHQLGEARGAAKLQHPNLVPLFEVLQDDHYQYLVSEFCAGPTLSRYLRENRDSFLPIEWVVAIVESLSEAVAYAHRMGLVHRDIKPGNILLVPQNPRHEKELPFVPRLTDFGLAQELSEFANQSSTKQIVGTFAYMAPEQFGRDPECDPRKADMYALGLILYQLLTTRLPFDGLSTRRWLKVVRSQSPPTPDRDGRPVPCDLSAICLHCLHFDPMRRYESVEDLIDDLQRFRDRREVSVRHRPLPERLRTAAIRSPMVTTLLAMIVAMVLVAGATLIRTNRQLLGQRESTLRAIEMLRRNRALSEQSRIDAVRLAAEASRQREVAKANQTRAQNTAFRSDMRNAMSGLARRNFAAARSDLESIRQYASPEHLRRFDFQLANSISVADVTFAEPVDSRVEEILFVPDTGQVAIATHGGHIHFYDMASGTRVDSCRPVSDALLHAAAVSRDGRTLALGLSRPGPNPSAGRRNEVRVIDRESGDVKFSAKHFSTTIESVALGPEADSLLVGCRYRSLIGINFAEPASRNYIRVHERNHDLCWCKPNRLVGLYDGHEVRCWNIDTAEAEWKQREKSSVSIDRIAASADAAVVAYTHRKDSVILCFRGSNSDEDRRCVIEGDGSFLEQIAVSPSGRYVAAGSVSGKTFVWRIEPETLASTDDSKSLTSAINATVHSRSSHRGLVSRMVVDDDGKVWSTSMNSDVCFWPSQQDSSLRAKRFCDDANRCVTTLSLDGRYRLSSNDEGVLTIHDARENRTEALNEPTGVPVDRWTWRSDGRVVAATDVAGRLSLISIPKSINESVAMRTCLVPSGESGPQIDSACFSPDGKRLAVCQGRYTVSVVDVPDFEAAENFAMPQISSVKVNRSAYAILWIDNQHVVTVSDTIRRWKVGEPEEVELAAGVHLVQSAILGPSGKELLVGVGDGKIYRFDLQGNSTGISEPWLPNENSKLTYRNIETMLIAPDAQTIMAGSTTGEIGLWDVHELTFIGTLPIEIEPTRVASMQWIETQRELWIHWSYSVTSRFSAVHRGSMDGRSLVLGVGS